MNDDLDDDLAALEMEEEKRLQTLEQDTAEMKTVSKTSKT